MNAVIKAPVSQALRPQTFGELMQFAERAARSSMVPPAYKGKPDDIVLAIQMGSEVGLAPMQALQNIAVIGGRPAIWGDAMPGLCRQSAVCDDIEEWFEGDGETLTAFCRATRTGKKPVLQQFSVADARKAGLWSKAGPWTQYPRRMLQMRARGFALRDAFPDVLRGLIAVEEAQDIPPERPFTGTTLEHTPAPEPPQPEAAPAASLTNGHAKPTEDPLDEPNGTKWLKILAVELSNAPSQEAVATIAGHRSVTAALENAPTMIKARINDMLTDAYARFAETEAQRADEPSDPMDVLIARIEAMDFITLRTLDTNAAYRTELNALPADAARAVVEAVSGRLANLRAGA